MAGKNSPANNEEKVGARKLTIAETQAGQRLDNFLFKILKGVPKSRIYQILRTGQIRVNGKRTKPDFRISAEDIVRIPPLRMATTSDPPKAPQAALNKLASAIIFEDKLFLVLDKPSGLASHGGSGIQLGAIEQLRQLRPNEPLELVHRLDRDTSGILMIAKKRSALTAVQELMRTGKIKKRYLALLNGRLQKPLKVDVPLRKDILQGGERMVRIDHDNGKSAISYFKPLQEYGDFTLAEVLIETGRTHQIRVHAQYIGHPVAGDEKYGNEETNKALKKSGLKRMFLHAAELKFKLPEKETYLFSAPLSDDLNQFLINPLNKE